MAGPETDCLLNGAFVHMCIEDMILAIKPFHIYTTGYASAHDRSKGSVRRYLLNWLYIDLATKCE